MKRAFSWRPVALAAALAALIVAFFFLVQFLNSAPVAARGPIPVSEITSAQGFSSTWHVPHHLWTKRWHRTEACVYEDDKPLPLRVETLDLVANQGKGRFGIEEETLAFSASDNSNPAKNGRRYEFEIRRPTFQAAVRAGICLAVTLVLGLLAISPESWARFRTELADPGAGHARLLRRLAAVLAVLAIFFLTQLIKPFRIVAHESVPARTLINDSDKEFSYYLPRWVKKYDRLDFATLSEDQKPLKRLNPWAWPKEAVDGSFCFSLGRILFRTSDGSNPALNSRTYRIAIVVFPPNEAWRLAVFLFLLSLILFAYAPEMEKAPIPWWRLRQAGWWLAMVAVGLLKLWMVAGDEVRTAEADAWGYASSASAMVWSGTDLLSTHPAGFPMIAGLLGLVGVPWRMMLETLYLGACGGLAVVLASLLRSRFLAVLLFAAMAWHPWTLAGFRDFMAYPMVTVLSVTMLALMFRVLSQPSSHWRWPLFFGLGLILFFWEWSRTEDPLVYGAYGLFAVLAWSLALTDPDRAPRRKRLTMLLLPVLMVYLLGTGVRLINYAHFGIYAKSQISVPGLVALMRALYRIKPESQVRYAPVTRQSLQAACRASPILGASEQALLDPDALPTKYGEQFTKKPGEFGPWLNWLLPQCLPGDSRARNAAMLQAAGEINAALRDGRLPHRLAWFPVDPNWRLWLPDYLPSFARSLRAGSSLQWWTSWPTADRPTLVFLFNEVANRRVTASPPRLLAVEGSFETPAAGIDSAALGDRDGKFLAASGVTSNHLTGKIEFQLHAGLLDNRGDYGLVFFRKGQPVASDITRSLSPDAMLWTNSIVLPENAGLVTCTYRFSVLESEKQGRVSRWEPKAERVGKSLVWGGLLLGCLALGCGNAWELNRFRQALACLVLAGGWFLSRAALYALVDATAGWQPERYMRCVSPLAIMILFLAGAIVVALVRNRFRKGASAATVPATSDQS